MGYTTEFQGKFKFNKEVHPLLVDYVNKFCGTRRMNRNLPDHYGTDGEFYIKGTGFAGQDREDNIVDYNRPPSTQPGLWCQWELSPDGKYLYWDGGEKFYYYTEWLSYLINNFFEPFAISLEGEIRWRGEDFNDMGRINVKDNSISVESSHSSSFEVAPVARMVFAKNCKHLIDLNLLEGKNE